MRRVLLSCGIAAPLLYAVADTVAGLRWPGYSFRDQTISELGAVGAPSRVLFSALLVVSYALLLAFGFGIVRYAHGRAHLKRAGALIMALGLLALTVGQFSAMKPRGTSQGLSGALHLGEGAVAMLLLFLAMGFASGAFAARFRAYTLATMAVVLGLGAWTARSVGLVESGAPTAWLGVQERTWWYAYQLWFVVLALTMLRENRWRDS